MLKHVMLGRLTGFSQNLFRNEPENTLRFKLFQGIIGLKLDTLRLGEFTQVD